jgi:hypothetical protein
MVTGGVEDFWIVIAKDEGCFPVEPIAATLRCAWADEALFAGSQVASAHGSVLAFGIDLIGIGWVDQANESIAAANIHPIAV